MSKKDIEEAVAAGMPKRDAMIIDVVGDAIKDTHDKLSKQLAASTDRDSEILEQFIKRLGLPE